MSKYSYGSAKLRHVAFLDSTKVDLSNIPTRFKFFKLEQVLTLSRNKGKTWKEGENRKVEEHCIY